MDKSPRLIALNSPAMGSGKSVVAEELVNGHGFVPLKFAGFLKAMFRALLREIGYDEETIERYVEGNLKEKVVPELGVTARHAMQTLGTEWGRNCIREDLWAHLTQIKAARLMVDAKKSVVIDDLRFPNEMEKVLEIGGHCVRVVRPGAERTNGHVSEGQLDAVAMLQVVNDGTLEDLRRQAGTLAACPLR